MSFNEVLILLAIGLVAGTLSGLIGVGGGIVVIPALVFVMGFSQHLAQGTSIAMMVPPIGILAAMNYYREGQVNISAAVVLVLAFFVGSYLGSSYALSFPPKYLKKGFGVIMLVVAAKFLLSK